MEDRRIRSILIVGGGTAGWLSAAYLNRALGRGVRITLIESSAVPRIGVGEATIPTLKSTLKFIGVDEHEWMAACNGSFKAAIRYKDWRKGPRPAGNSPVLPDDDFYHPFFPRPETLIQPFDVPFFSTIGEGFSAVHYWMKRAVRGQHERFDRLASSIPALCDARKFGGAQDEHGRLLPYAYHMDAGLLAVFLRDLCVRRGVEHVVDHVKGVSRDERGFIAVVRTESGATLVADLYIDCSGFQGLLIRKTLDEPFVSHQKYLLNDRAVAIHARHDAEKDGLEPYTLAHARSSGWSFHIPLYHRYGTGYVYSSAFLSQERAEAELREALGRACEGMSANPIQILVGHSRRLWVNNCVAVGLAGVFIEPLESTGIFLIEYQLANLIALFPNRQFDPVLARRFDEIVIEMYLQIRDFIVMHYITSEREDTPYWRFIKNELEIPESLAHTLEAYRSGLPIADSLKLHVFRATAWASVLSGMNTLPARSSPILEHVDEAVADRHFSGIAAHTERLLSTTPGHFDYLRRLHGEAPGR